MDSFKDMMNDVVEYGSCCECGTCVLVCPHNIIEYIDGKPKQTAKASAAHDFCGISEGIGCDVCAQVCPRLGDREFHLEDSVFAGQEGQTFDGGFGKYQEIFVARAVDQAVLDIGQDGGVVTTILLHCLEQGIIDGAVVSAPDPEKPCSPMPVCATTADEIRDAAGSWYTYCPNDLAMEQAAEKQCESVAFVGVPCQVTPLRKAELFDPGLLVNERKKPKHLERQTASIKGPADRVTLSIGLLCSEVFNFAGLMEDMIQRDLGIPLSTVRKFNVKGKVLVYPEEGEVVEIELKDAQQHAREACEHCGDFSAELADISCGGVGAMDWTITVVRTDRGREIMDGVVAAGLIERRPIEEFEGSLKTLLRLARRQHQRVPAEIVPPSAVHPPHFLRPG
jgi:coenzyme F420 hydrogenase subunit beta